MMKLHFFKKLIFTVFFAVGVVCAGQQPELGDAAVSDDYMAFDLEQIQHQRAIRSLAQLFLRSIVFTFNADGLDINSDRVDRLNWMFDRLFKVQGRADTDDGVLVDYGPTMFSKEDFLRLNSLLKSVREDIDARVFLLDRFDRPEIIMCLKRREQKLVGEIAWCDKYVGLLDEYESSNSWGYTFCVVGGLITVVGIGGVLYVQLVQ